MSLDPTQTAWGRARRSIWHLAFAWLVTAQAAASTQWVEQPGYRYRILTQEFQEAAPSEQGFESILPQSSGVTFTLSLSEASILQNQNYMNGSGLALGDFDGDGKCDLFFCSITGTNALYRNLGNWQFEDVTARAGVAMDHWPSAGATFADISGDGHKDLLVSTFGKGVRCWINDGSGRFKDQTETRGLNTETGSTSMALGDIDRDGDLDLYVTQYGEIPIVHSGGGAKLKRVNGQWKVTGPFAKRLRIVDGKLEELGEPDQLWINQGKGFFTPAPWGGQTFLNEEGQPQVAPWEFGLSAQMRDINADGALDIYVCNDFQSPDRIWINQGNGTFKAIARESLRKQSYASMGVDFADLDRDGHLDFFVVEMLPATHQGRMQQVSGLRPEIPYPARVFNRPEVARNTLFKNLGDGHYAEIANLAGLAATDWSWQPLLLDVDLDGLEDILVVNGMPHDIQDRDTLESIRAEGKQQPEVSRRNVLRYPKRHVANMAFRNQGAWNFSDTSQKWAFDHVGVSYSAALVDLDQDGDQDLVVQNLHGQPLLLKNRATQPRLWIQLEGSTENRDGVGAKIEVICPGLPKQVQEVLGGGRYLAGDDPQRTFACSASQKSSVRVLWPDGEVSHIADLPPNSLCVIQRPSRGSIQPPSSPALRPVEPRMTPAEKANFEHVHHEQLFNDFSRQMLLPRLESQAGPGMGWVDLDQDGREELIIGTGRGGRLGAFRKDSAGNLNPIPASQPWLAPGDTLGMCAWTWDNGLSSMLFAVSNYEAGSASGSPLMQARLNDQGLLVIEAIPNLPNNIKGIRALAAVDVDADGDLDLFIGGEILPGAYPHTGPSFLLVQKNGKLEAADAQPVIPAPAGIVQGALWSDLDADGYPELVLSQEWGPIGVFKNEQGKLQRWKTTVHLQNENKEEIILPLDKLTGWWRGVASGDFNEDGLMDLVIANWGRNDAYAATPEKPLLLHGGPFARPGVTDLLEWMFDPDLNHYVSVRPYSDLREHLPSLRPIGSHAAFGKHTMMTLLQLLKTDVVPWEAGNLETTILLNHSTHWVAASLPLEAQWAPVFSVNVGDINGDGHQDVFLSQNFFATRPYWPRLDAGQGLWLKGNGTGVFTPATASETGIRVLGEQRSSILGDVNQDGKIDLVVSQNALETRMFLNQGQEECVAVSLKGSRKNPRVVGATVRLETSTGMGPALEVQAGSGYFSQNSQQLLFGQSATPKAIHVRWPGGQESQHPYDASSKVQFIKMPPRED